MRDPIRINRTAIKLIALWHTYPDMRLAQLVVNIASRVNPAYHTDPFHCEDDAFEAELDNVLAAGWG